MFTNLQAFLESDVSLEVDKQGSPSSQELQVATVALLSEIAHVHGELAPQELSSIIDALYEEFGLGEVEAGHLLEIGDYLRQDVKKLDSFISAVASHFDPEQKIKLLTIAWKVIIADGVADEAETTLAATLRKRLGLTLEQAMRAQALSQLPPPASAKKSKSDDENEDEE